MNKFLIVLLTLLFNIQQANAFNIDAFMDKNVAPVSDAIAAVIFHPVHVFGADEVLQFGALSMQSTLFSNLKNLMTEPEKLHRFRL